MGTSLQKMRENLLKKAEEISSQQQNGFEFVPPVGKTNVRVLPMENHDHFYYTHSYHYLPNDGGRYLFTPREFEVDGKLVKDPIDEAVRQWYEEAKATKDEALKKIAGQIKRKRHYFFHVLLLDEEDPEKKLRVLVDKSNDGKLVRKLCAIMGLPFFKSFQDNKFDANSLNIDKDKKYFDIMDMDKGHDIRIIKIQDGPNPWDISYDDTFPLGEPRPLTKEEKTLANKREDLFTYKNYETNFYAVKAALESFIDSIQGTKETSTASNNKEEEEEVQVQTKSATQSSNKKQQSSQKQKSEPDDEEIDAMLSEIE